MNTRLAPLKMVACLALAVVLLCPMNIRGDDKPKDTEEKPKATETSMNRGGGRTRQPNRGITQWMEAGAVKKKQQQTGTGQQESISAGSNLPSAQGATIPGVDVIIKKTPGGIAKRNLPGFTIDSERVRSADLDVVIHVVNGAAASYVLQVPSTPHNPGNPQPQSATQQRSERTDGRTTYLVNYKTKERISLDTLSQVMGIKPSSGKSIGRKGFGNGRQ